MAPGGASVESPTPLVAGARQRNFACFLPVLSAWLNSVLNWGAYFDLLFTGLSLYFLSTALLRKCVEYGQLLFFYSRALPLTQQPRGTIRIIALRSHGDVVTSPIRGNVKTLNAAKNETSAGTGRWASGRSRVDLIRTQCVPLSLRKIDLADSL